MAKIRQGMGYRDRIVVENGWIEGRMAPTQVTILTGRKVQDVAKSFSRPLDFADNSTLSVGERLFAALSELA